MCETQMSVESCFVKGEKPNDEAAEATKAANKTLHVKENTKNPASVMSSLQ